MHKSAAADVFEAGDFEIHLGSGELFRRGEKVHLQERPFQILAMLLKCRGEMVSREQLRQGVWKSGTFVNFDQNLNIAVAKLRKALGDSTEHPFYIETVASRGYRFIAPVHSVERRENSDQQNGKGKLIRLAVLPFEGRNTTPEQTYFAAGLTDELIAQLGQLYSKHLRVIALTSTARYKGTNKTLRQIGRELRVDYILEGGVRGAGDRMRITTQLVQVEDQTYLWGDSYEVPLTDMLTVQNEVAANIARALKLGLLPGRQNPLIQHSPSVGAYLLYLKGRQHLFKRTEESLLKSAEYFERAIAEDAEYDMAYCALAESHLYRGLMGYAVPAEIFLKTKEAAQKALEMNDTLPEAHAYLGAVKYLHEWNWPEAEQMFERALRLNPGNASSHRLYGQYLSRRNRHAEAFEEIQRALEFDPLPMMTNATICSVLYNAHRYDQALVEVQKILELEPKSAPALMFLGLIYEQKGMMENAAAALQMETSNHPNNPLAWGHLGHVYAVMHDTENAREVLRKLQELSSTHYVPAFCLSLVHLGLNDQDATWELLERAYEERSPFLAFFLGPDPRFDRLRSDAKFQDLLGRIGLNGAC